jgi:hypothetical protein
MTRGDLNDAIGRLRKLNRDAAGVEAALCAERLLPVAAKYRTPADRAALLIVSLALYHSAVTRMTEEHGAAQFCATIEKRYEAFAQGAAAGEIFKTSPQYPQKLEQYRLVLIDLLKPILAAAFEIVRHGIESIH